MECKWLIGLIMLHYLLVVIGLIECKWVIVMFIWYKVNLFFFLFVYSSSIIDVRYQIWRLAIVLSDNVRQPSLHSFIHSFICLHHSLINPSIHLESKVSFILLSDKFGWSSMEHILFLHSSPRSFTPIKNATNSTSLTTN